MVLIAYDVRTEGPEGRKRLRRVASALKDFGQRVQYSVFECELDPARWTALRSRLIDLIDPAEDSLRFYMLGANWRAKVEHIGAKPATDFDGPLIF